MELTTIKSWHLEWIKKLVKRCQSIDCNMNKKVIWVCFSSQSKMSAPVYRICWGHFFLCLFSYCSFPWFHRYFLKHSRQWSTPGLNLVFLVAIDNQNHATWVKQIDWYIVSKWLMQIWIELNHTLTFWVS